MSVSRRTLLTAAGLGAAGSLLPPSVHEALAREPRRGGLSAIKHVVLLMQENRSFDHYYGTLRGVRGFSDRNALDGVFNQSGVLPFSVREARGTRDIQYIGDLDHSWDGGHRALRGGWHDNWVPAKTPATMAYYDRLDLPFHHELADTFTLCDAYFCSVPSSTSPNRNYWVSGYTGFEASGARAVGNSAYAEDTHPGYTWTTYPERLSAAGVSWQVFQEWDNYQDNNLEFFTRFKDIARKALRGSHKSLDSFYADVFRSPNPQDLLAGLASGVAQLSPPDRALYDRALHRVRPGTLGAEFRAAVESGRLPAVSYLVPSSVDSEHPGASSPAASASITYQVLDALASVPEVWDTTALFITYDENDGYFDHVPPPRPPLGVTDEYVGDRPLGLGPRVPMTVVSPWTAGGYVCSEIFDHTSNTRFLERWLDVAEPNISAWRRRVSGDLTSAFDFTRRGTRPVVAAPGPVPPATPRWRPTPPADQHMPTQEPGTRPARPLPYQPEVTGRVVDGSVRLSLRNSGQSSAHLALYPYRGEFEHPVHFDVSTPQDFTVPFTSAYRFTVLGPNGFRREFAGEAGERVAVESSVNGHSRVLTITLANTGDHDETFEVTGDGRNFKVTVRPGKRRTLPWLTAFHHGWYDLTIHNGPFHRRLAGHVENGRESISG
ncbi:phosphocholine-specific phospholipase C [Saccharothrix variisporea]|uniref:phospholipase C n=1 Tax=Saccharothrix variisporea TaxID=543527 RepID=A0A495XLS0_9PSEU|nr:phospholipase C, phosphocholine-specific [Saccharothrix variisporea]RKT73844.1 phospholipase C [Saccharothrix variisporea]